MRKKVLRILGVALAIALILGLLPVMPTFAAGTLAALNPSSGSPGTTVYLSGAGFPNGTITIYFNTTATTTGAYSYSGGSTTTGAFTNIPITVPYSISRGTYAIWVVVGGETSAAQSFIVIPGITLSASSGYVGDQITIAGSGYSAGTTVTIYYDSVAKLTTTATTYGIFSVTYTIPQGVRGNHTITAIGSAAGETDSKSFSTLSKLTVSPTSGSVGTPLTITGTGYAPNSAISVFFDSASATSTVSDTYGSFTISNFPLPVTKFGDHAIQAQDATANSQTVNISVLAGISVEPATGPVGTQVTVSGNGFRASESITISLDNTAITTSGVTTDANGHFSTVVNIPAIPSGAHQLKAADSVNNDTETFTVIASAIASPASGYVGTKITVNGSGFTANQAITITFDNTPAGTATSNTQGSFTASFEALSRQAGVYKIRVTDGPNFKEINFTVTTSATITTTSASSPGHVGATITVSGVGFKAGANLVVTYDGKQVATGTVGADTNFSVPFLAPVSKAGPHTLTVSDGLVSIPLTYYMDSTAPASSTLVEPETGKRQKAQGAFVWSSVSDPSGVTYTLQIASNSSFGSGSILVEKTGLTATEYTLTKEEKLKSTKKDAPNFWRVKAIDNASNEGNWSNIWTFTVGGVLPTWALWTLIGLGALIILLFAYWLGRRSSNKPAATRIVDA